MVGGLSPPTRGSRSSAAPPPPLDDRRVYPRPRGGAGQLEPDGPGSGSIPAHAGEPACSRIASVRVPIRSIPAHAGEPWNGTTRACRFRVYPRPRGGACGCPRCRQP